jgi:hypothetical protein
MLCTSFSVKFWWVMISAKRNHAFCFFFWKKKCSITLIVSFEFSVANLTREAELGSVHRFLENYNVSSVKSWLIMISAKRNNAFCFFFWKKKTPLKRLIPMVRLRGCFVSAAEVGRAAIEFFGWDQTDENFTSGNEEIERKDGASKAYEVR